MIQTEGFILSGGGSDYPPKSTARKDSFPDSSSTSRKNPFPDSSSTPVVSIGEICDDPSDPDYWKKNITTQKDNSLHVPISQPGIPVTEFAERLIALEQENVVLREELNKLKEVVSVILMLTCEGIPVLTQYYGHRVPTDELKRKWVRSICEWAKEHGVDPVEFSITPDGFEITPKEEAKDDDTKGTD